MEWLIVGICVALIAFVCGLALAAGRADDHAERCAGRLEKERHEAGFDDIDRIYLESEKSGDA